jgi:uncharacterized protein (DUF1499 family)
MRYGRRVRNAIGLLAVLAVLLGPAFASLGVVRPLAGFAMFALGGIVALVTGLVSLIGLARGRRLTLGGGLAAAVGIVFLALATRSAGHPRINDFSTDLDVPPGFTFAATLEPNVGRDLTYPYEYAAIQRQCCADLRPAMLPIPPRAAYERALRTASTMPAWRITRADGSELFIEATATSRVFQFVDDVVIRVRPEGDGGSRVDIRSKSRDGKGDVGANTARIRAYVAALESAT